VLNLRNAAGKLVQDAMHVLVKCLTEMWVLKASFLTSGANLRQEVSSIQHLYSTRPHDNGIISIDYDNDYISREAQPRRNVYWPRPSVCLSLATFPHYCTDPDVTWRISTGCPLVHYWADLQSMHGFRCYTVEHETPASARTRSMPGYYCSVIVTRVKMGYSSRRHGSLYDGSATNW